MEYWRTLEESFCGRKNEKGVTSVFPATAVPEVLNNLQWCTRKLMSTKKRVALFNRIAEVLT